tara:strand:- start:53615 stop:54235 length:621 start_codon:yes stop_codon:yes gene_type:complete
MNYLKSKYQYSKLLYIVALVMMSSCFKQHEKVTNRPKLKDFTIGEKWTWKYKGVSGEGEVRSEGVDVKEIVNLNGELGMTVENDTILISDILKPIKSKTPRYKWPLEVGKKWKYERDFTSAVGVKGIWSQDVEVLSFKEVTVEAGTFMAYTIEYKGAITNSKGLNAKTDDVWVYAPEIKNFIKMTQIQEGFSYSEELIKYSNPNKK